MTCAKQLITLPVLKFATSWTASPTEVSYHNDFKALSHVLEFAESVIAFHRFRRGADSVRHHLPHAGTHSHLQTLNTKMRTTPQPSTWLSLRFSDHFQTRRTSTDTQPHVDEAYPKPQERVSVPVHGRVHRCAECQKRTQRCHSVSAPVPVESDGSLHG